MASRSSKTVRLSIVPLMAASFLAGCGDDEETAYCVDENDEVIENRFCEDEYDGNSSGGVFFWYFGGGGTSYTKGQRVAGGEKVRASDRAALARRGGFGANRSSSGGIGRSYSSGSSGGG